MRLLTAVSLVRVQQGEPAEKPLLSTKSGEVFSCIFGRKQANYSEIRLQSGQTATTEPDFFTFGPRKRQKLWCTFAFLCSAKIEQKCLGGETRTRVLCSEAGSVPNMALSRLNFISIYAIICVDSNEI